MDKTDASNERDILKDLSTSLSFQPDDTCLQALQNSTILVKAGGNALTNLQIKKEIVSQIAGIKHIGGKPVVVHGGGIAIQQLLDKTGTPSEFIGGHRKTDSGSMKYVEMALSGQVNKELVSLLNQAGVKAVGISGKDAGMVTAKKRYHTETENGIEKQIDLGYVGDVESVNPELVQSLLAADYVPVVSPVSSDSEGNNYNINADMFAGHLAGALSADKFIAMTNIDGLLEDVNDPDSILHELSAEKARSLFGTVIQGGMIPKIEACLIALEKGVQSSHIINGMKKESLLHSTLTTDKSGTTIKP